MSLSAKVKGLPASSVELIPSVSDYGRADLHRVERLPTFLPPAATLNKTNKSDLCASLQPVNAAAAVLSPFRSMTSQTF